MHQPESRPIAAIAALALAVGALAQSPSLFLAASPTADDPLALGFTNGVLIADFNGDGRTDILFAQSASPNTQANRLLLGVDGISFRDHSLSLQSPSLLRVTCGDIDGDQDLDVVAISASGTSLFVVILRNDGQGNFADVTSTKFPFTYAEPNCIELGDIDGDGDLDLFVGHGYSSSQQNRLYRNDGSGSFTEATQGGLPYVQDWTKAAVFGDVDGDGDVDLLVGNHQQQCQLALNDGQGHFTSVTATHLPPASSKVVAMRLGDLDGDGDLDLVVGSDYPDSNHSYANDGSGHFTAAAFNTWSCKDLILFDADADADLDIFLAVDGIQNQLFLNDGTGSFQNVSATNLPDIPDASRSAAAGDLDQDGRLDLVVANYPEVNHPIPDGRNILLHNLGGRFVDQPPPVRAPGGAWIPPRIDDTNAVLLLDCDGDGDLDMFVGNDFHQQNRFYRNDGHGRFEDVTQAVLPADSDNTVEVAAGDIDRDGVQDLVLTNYGGRNRVYLGSAAGSFVDATAARLPVEADLSISVALGDLDGDGDLDIVFGNNGQDRVLVNDGQGTMADNTWNALPPLPRFTSQLRLGDIDGDGDLDLIALMNDSLGVFSNNGAGIFTDVTATALPSGLHANTAVLADLDGDGDLDLFAAGYSSSMHQAFVYRNNGNGTFVPLSTFSTLTAPPADVAAADLDADGDLDIVMATKVYCQRGCAFGPSRIFRNAGNATLTPVDLPDDTSTTRTFAIGDVDGDGDLDLVAGNRYANAAAGHPFGEQNRIFSNLTRQLVMPAAPRLGTPLVIQAWSQSSLSPGPFATFTALSLGSLAAPLALPPFGTLALDPSTMAVMPLAMTANGVATVSLPVPNSLSLIGVELFLQAVVEGRDAANQQTYRFTNMISERILR